MYIQYYVVFSVVESTDLIVAVNWLQIRVSVFQVVVSFPLVESPDVSLIAWTTTPWTLPSNVALCVHPDLEYVKTKG